MGAVGLNITDTFYAKNNPIYFNLENLLSDEISDELEYFYFARRLQCRPSEFGNYPVLSRAMTGVRRAQTDGRHSIFFAQDGGNIPTRAIGATFDVRMRKC